MAVKVRHASKTDLAYRKVRTILETSNGPDNGKLTETRLAGMIGMKRGPVRESLLRLEAEGVIRFRGQRRGRVIEYTEDQDKQELISRYELRELIQAGVVRLVAMNLNGWQIDRLRELATRVDHYKMQDHDRRFETVTAFWEYLLEHCGNRMLNDAWHRYRLMPAMPRSMEFEAKILSHLSTDQRGNTLIDLVDAIATHDPDHAEARSRQHVRAITDAIRQTDWPNKTPRQGPS